MLGLRPALLLLVLLTSSLAWAGDDDDTEAARIHYKAGEQYYVRGHYTQAIAEFKEAFRLSKASALLYNISQAYERAGDLAQARDYLKRYMDSGETDAGEMPALKEKLASLDKRISSTTQLPPPPKEPVKPPPVALTVTPRGGPVHDEAPGPARPLKTWKWVTAGSGAGLLVIAGLFALDGQKQEQRLEDDVVDPPNVTYTPEINDIYQRGKRANAIAVVTGIAGVALVGTAVVFFVMDARDKEREQPAGTGRMVPLVTPLVGPTVAGAAAVWRF